ncbi:MAG: hypothetical protein L6R36_000426 [Xanthoria steineri]|nr:MAG: hypothetical protein L6R36_000426 [Xanthoria steineri]
MARAPRGPSRGRVSRSGPSHHDPNRRPYQWPNTQNGDPPTRGGRGGRGVIDPGRGGRGTLERGRGGRGANDRARGLRIRGRGRGNFHGDASWNAGSQGDRHTLVKIVVRGVLDTDVANEGDSGLAKCREWLEERARQGSKKPMEYVYLLSPRWEGDDLVFEVKNSDVWRILKSHGQEFRNVVLSVQRADYQRSGNATAEDGEALSGFQSNESLNVEGPKGEAFKAVLIDRYDAKNKLLKLDRLVDDARLQGTGTWDPSAARPKRTDFFGGLMRLCGSESVFADRATKAEQVQSISLTNNGLTSVGPVLDLARAFPDIRNLDLSNNRFGDLRALEPFRGKFKKLEWLILTPNPMQIQASTVVSWFPSLQTLDDAQVSTELGSLNPTAGNELPFGTIKDNFQDQGGIAESAIRDLLLGTDSDRASLVAKLYDDDSTFSLSYNSSAPRLATAQSTNWEAHVKQSRNLKKVTSLGPRIQRLARGVAQIQEAFKTIPPTRHPDLVGESSRYSFDCTPIPGVPDPQNGSACGVGGLKVDVHGSFDEIDNATGIHNATRSFDRVFILGPGKGQQPLRIISDILILRAEGGHDAFNPQVTTRPELPSSAETAPFPADSSKKQATVAGEVSKATGLTMEWATNLLSESGWDFQTALENFKAARTKGVLQNQFFSPEVCAPAVTNPTGVFY